MNIRTKIIGIIGILLLSIMVPIAMSASNVADNNAAQINTKIPNPHAPALPAGFTKQQVQAAKDIVTKEQANITANVTKKAGLQPASTGQYGNGDFFVTWPFVDTQYNDYKYSTTVYPSLYLPLRTGVWNTNWYTTGGYQPASGYYVITILYYWNYYLKSWSLEEYKNGYTDSNGEFRPGFIIPYRQLSDKYFMYEVVYNSQFTQFQQMDTKYFNIGWY